MARGLNSQSSQTVLTAINTQYPRQIHPYLTLFTWKSYLAILLTKTHRPPKFQGNPVRIFRIILLTAQLTNKLTRVKKSSDKFLGLGLKTHNHTFTTRSALCFCSEWNCSDDRIQHVFFLAPEHHVCESGETHSSKNNWLTCWVCRSGWETPRKRQNVDLGTCKCDKAREGIS